MAAKKSKAKEWITIKAPDYFGGIELGKTPVDEPEKVLGRRITVSGVEVIEDTNKFYLKLFFKIVKLDGTNALTDFDGSEVMRDYLSRMVIRRVSRIDTVQDLKTKDGKMIRVKGLAVISRKAKRNVQLTVKKRIFEMVKDQVTNLTLDEFLRKIFSDEIKNRVLQEARSVYPVRNFEIRKTQILQH